MVGLCIRGGVYRPVDEGSRSSEEGGRVAPGSPLQASCVARGESRAASVSEPGSVATASERASSSDARSNGPPQAKFF